MSVSQLETGARSVMGTSLRVGPSRCCETGALSTARPVVTRPSVDTRPFVATWPNGIVRPRGGRRLVAEAGTAAPGSVLLASGSLLR